MLDGDINDRRKVFACPVEATLSIMGGRWKPLILHNLRDQRLRYSELKAKLPNPSDRMLSRSLKEMARDGLIERTVDGTGAVQVSYQVTASGHGLLPALDAMCDWAHAHWYALEKEDTA